MKPEKHKEMPPSQEGAPDATREIEKQPETVFYLFSDIHGLSKQDLDSLLQKVEATTKEGNGDNDSEQQKFTILMGDLPNSGIEDELIREFKKADGDKSKLHFKDKEQEKIFDEIVAKRGWRAGAYRQARLNTSEEITAARNDALEKNRKVAERMSEFPNPIVLAGNAETNAPYEGIGQEYEDHEVPYHTKPQFVDLDERALIIWPSTKDPKTLTEEERKEFTQSMEETTRELLEQSKDKKEIIIVSHEQIFHGSRDYKRRVRDKGEEPYGAPYKGVNPSRKHILKLIASLPEDQKIAMAFGHLHDPQETVTHGTGFKLEDTGSGGMGKLSVSTRPIDSGEKTTRSVELFYVPHNEVGILTVDKEGFRFQTAK